MVSVHELASHGWALLTVLGAVGIPGYLLTRPLRRQHGLRDTLAIAPLAGVAYWSVALYLLPFRGGLWLAMGLVIPAAGMLATKAVKRRRRHRNDPPHESGHGVQHRLAKAVLVLGCLAYLTPLLTQHVPLGMDASRYIASARVLARTGGFVDSLAPFAPQIPLGGANHGVSVVAAVSTMLGARPEAAVLAMGFLAYASLLLSTYVLIRVRSNRLTAAVIATGIVWMSRSAQTTLGWGGWATILGIAMGVVACRLMLSVIRRPRSYGAFLLGLMIGAIPLVHGVAAAEWIYIALPAAFVTAVFVSRQRIWGLAAMGLTGIVVVLVLATFYWAAQPRLDPVAVDYLREYTRSAAPEASGLALVPASLAFAVKHADTNLSVAAITAFAVLLITRRWATACISLAAFVAITAILVNAKYWLLPASQLLLPERAVYWMVPLGALTVAMAWRPVRAKMRYLRGGRLLALVAAIVLLSVGLARHEHYYQENAFKPAISQDEWAFLQWARENLDSDDYVWGPYSSAGSYLPGVAGVATDGWHLHFQQQIADAQMVCNRVPTHQLIVNGRKGSAKRRVMDADAFETREVFRSGDVRLLKLTPLDYVNETPSSRDGGT